MGQCILRDLGFDLEEKGQKKDMLDAYVQEKMRAKYPDAPRIQKQKSDISSQGEQGIPQLRKNTSQPFYQSDIEMTDGRLSRPNLKKRMKETVVQTENRDDDAEKVPFNPFMTLPTVSSKNPSAKKTPRGNRENASFYSADGQEVGSSDNNGLAGVRLGSSYYPRTKSPLASSRNNLVMGGTGNGTPLRMKSENTIGVSGFRPSANAVENNMFKGIEKLNMKEPVKSEETGRREIKGFKNKYFQPVGQRSPSPKHHVKLLDEDDDEDFPYDDYQ